MDPEKGGSPTEGSNCYGCYMESIYSGIYGNNDIDRGEIAPALSITFYTFHFQVLSTSHGILWNLSLDELL